MRERHGRVLAELAEAGMAMVRRLGEAMARTEDVQVQAQIGLAFHRVSRAVRQTMALEFRLAQEARREDRPAAPAHRASPSEPMAAGAVSSRPQAERTGWNEYESDDSDEALDALDELLEAEDFDLGAVHEAVETCIARIRDDLSAEPAPAEAGVPRLGGRRSQLMGASGLTRPPGRPTPLPPPFTGEGDRGPKPAKAGWRARGGGGEPHPLSHPPPIDPPSLNLAPSTTRSPLRSASGPPPPSSSRQGR